jgi:trimeric autotransporter adhesin
VDIAVLKTSQVVALTTSSLVALSTAQVFAFTTSQVEAFTTAQIASFTTAQVPYLHLGTPIILDLNGDGVSTLSVGAGVKFDLFADGNAVNTGWVSSTDGLLVLDRNHDGVINNGAELFGSSTQMADGSAASNGYVALRELDTNHDGVISAGDAAFADLQVWVDANSNGVSDSGETQSLTALGITSVSLAVNEDLSKDNGNLIGLTSTYQTSDGQTHAAADVWFVADKTAVVSGAVQTITPAAVVQSVDQAIADLNGSLANPVAVVADESAVLGGAASLLAATSPGDLRSLVSGLTQAIGKFDDSHGVDGGVPALQSPASTAASAPGAAALAVGSMAQVMSNFDANGNLVGNSVAVASPATLKPPGLNDPTASGYLSSGGRA